MSHDPPRFEVLLTSGAERDLESIFDHIAEFDSDSSSPTGSSIA
jgi:toxin ParE1/3/4